MILCAEHDLESTDIHTHQESSLWRDVVEHPIALSFLTKLLRSSKNSQLLSPLPHAALSLPISDCVMCPGGTSKRTTPSRNRRRSRTGNCRNLCPSMTRYWRCPCQRSFTGPSSPVLASGRRATRRIRLRPAPKSRASGRYSPW